MYQMLQNVNKSMEAQKLRIEEYNAETKRISAVSAGMNPEQVQEVVMQTLRDVMTAGDQVAAQQAPQMPVGPEMMPPQGMPPQGMPPQGMPPQGGM
jgi:hypothetical protein